MKRITLRSLLVIFGILSLVVFCKKKVDNVDTTLKGYIVGYSDFTKVYGGCKDTTKFRIVITSPWPEGGIRVNSVFKNTNNTDEQAINSEQTVVEKSTIEVPVKNTTEGNLYSASITLTAVNNSANTLVFSGWRFARN